MNQDPFPIKRFEAVDRACRRVIVWRFGSCRMTNNLINLRTARKRMARAEKERTAKQNRAVHGRTGAQKRIDSLEKSRREKALDDRKLDDGDHQES